MIWKTLFCLLCLIGASVAFGQERKPTAPEGWSMQAANDGWILTPRELQSGQRFTLIINKVEEAAGTLKSFFDNLWSKFGDVEVRRAPETLSEKAGDWDFMRGNGSLVQNGRSIQVSATALRKGEEQFAMIIVTDSAETFQRYSPEADRTLLRLLGVAKTGAPAAASGYEFEGTFPAGWRRGDGKGFRSARLLDNQGRLVRVLTAYPSEPVQGSLERTFDVGWNRELARAGIHLMNPGLLAPERPQPLRLRLKNGLVAYYEGGEGKFGQGTYCFLQLFMLPGKQGVSFTAALYVMDETGIAESDRAPVFAYLESLKSATQLPKQPLFTKADCVGHWQMQLTTSLAGFYSASGAYLGDASTGGLEDLTLRPDGTYTSVFAGKSPTLSFTSTESGTWNVDDTILTLTPTSGKNARVQKHRIYGRIMLDGRLNLLVGAADGSRIPTDALETGATLEIATRGGSLLRFEAK
jgi:hypothetical protein